MKKPARPAIDPRTLRTSMLRRVARRTKSRGSVSFPAVPGLVDHYMTVLDTIFSALGRPFAPDATAAARAMILEKLEWAFSRSHNSWIVVEWETEPEPKMSLSYTVTGWQKSVAETYAEWVETREPPLFGKHPDARVMDVARSLGPPAEVTCLDAGAGTGRNALPLARAGCVVDALELAPALAAEIEKAARQTGTDLRVVRGSFFDRALPMPRERYRLVVLAETCSHWRGQQDLTNVLTRLSELVEPGGVGLLNMFVAGPGYKPDPVERDFSQIVWSPIYTRHDVEQARAGLPLELVSDDSATSYERAHGSAGTWPPTGWFEKWASGSDMFDVPPGKAPFELRWLTLRRL